MAEVLNSDARTRCGESRFPEPPMCRNRQSSPSGTAGARTARRWCSYLLDSEVHTFAFSVAANAILSFIPFIVLLYTLADTVFHSHDDGEQWSTTW